MEESIKCECGNDKLWYFGEFVRCSKCLNEMKLTISGRKHNKELWLRRWNKQTCSYNSNWEHYNPR